MTLSTTEQDRIAIDYSNAEFVGPNLPANLNRDDIKAAANALDTFITDNLVAINNALPLPFRTTATQPQKLRLFKFVVARLELQ